jgi:hypothetical protein
MRNTLWAFGDSMTFGHGCNINCTSHIKDEYLPYKKEGDDVWSNHLGGFLKCEVKNLGKNGASNDYIFDTIIDNFDEIVEGDVVIINTTLYGRIEVPIGDQMFNVLSSYEDVIKIVRDGVTDDDNEKIETVINFQHHFSNHQFYKIRHKKRFEFIKNRLIKEKNIKFIYLWSLEDDDGVYSSFQTIKDHTKGKINDTHFSFNGHLNFAYFLLSLINKNKII